jgi:hypothetical protein
MLVEDVINILKWHIYNYETNIVNLNLI